MHYNENENVRQATNSKDINRWYVVYPKAHKGENAVVKPLKERATYSKYNNTKAKTSYVNDAFGKYQFGH